MKLTETVSLARARRSRRRPLTRTLSKAVILRLQFTQHCRDQLRYCGMDVHGVLERCEGRLRRHRVQDAVHGFIAADAEYGGAENLLRGASISRST